MTAQHLDGERRHAPSRRRGCRSAAAAAVSIIVLGPHHEDKAVHRIHVVSRNLIQFSKISRQEGKEGLRCSALVSYAKKAAPKGKLYQQMMNRIR